MKRFTQPSIFAGSILGGAMALTMVAAATAATITKTPSPPNPFDLQLTDPDFPPAPLELTFEQFNPALGNLTKVVYRLDSNIEASITVDGSGALDDVVYALAQMTFRVSGPGIAAEAFLVPEATCLVSDCPATGTETSLFTGDESDPAFVVEPPGDLNPYKGAGSVVVALSIVAGLIDQICPDECLTTFLATWGGSLELDYIYDSPDGTPVSVPTTLVLFGAGLLALAALTRSRAA